MKTEPQKHITCILPKGIAPEILNMLQARWEIVTSNINTARGIGKITPLKYRGPGDQAEKEILTVVVPNDIADTIFNFIYHEANINRPHGGLVYMTAPQYATSFNLPDLPTET